MIDLNAGTRINLTGSSLLCHRVIQQFLHYHGGARHLAKRQ